MDTTPEDFLRRIMLGEPVAQGPRTVYPDLRVRVDAAKTLLRHQFLTSRGTDTVGLGQLSLLEDVRL